MNEAAPPVGSNEAFLEAALAWLRARLEAMAGPERHRPGGRSHRRRGFLACLFGRGGRDDEAPAEAPSPTVEADLAQLREAVVRAAQTDPTPWLRRLEEIAGLTSFEGDTLLLCAAMDLDPRVAGLCARAQGDPAKPYPTFALALALFDGPHWDAIAPEGKLRGWRLIEVHQVAGHPLTASRLRADERIVSYVKGLNVLDDRLMALLGPIDPWALEAQGLPPSQDALADALAAQLDTARSGRDALVQLVGADAPSKHAVAIGAASRCRGAITFCRLPASVLAGPGVDMEVLVRLWQRESRLLDLLLYLDLTDTGSATEESVLRDVRRFVSRARGRVILDVREVVPDLPGTTLVLDVQRPTTAEQFAAWEAILEERPGGAASAGRLSGQFDMSLSSIRQVASSVSMSDRGDGPAGGATEDSLWEACRAFTRPRLQELAQRIDCKARWEDLILLPETEDLLRRAAEQVEQRVKVYDDWGFRTRMNRGLGITALFAGESGTGKTMAAEVLANHHRLDLYRIDLSAVIDKFIGETEKNLRRLFDAAEEAGAILFFDEADALFGKRSEVRDSHDRFANIQVNYLLQRMESYRGLAILATNMKNSLDAAFVRRLRFIIEFPFPDAARRKKIWERVFPDAVPKEHLAYDRLAALRLTGGTILNIALHASFRAAAANHPVTMAGIRDAAAVEFRKNDRPSGDLDLLTAPAEKVLA